MFANRYFIAMGIPFLLILLGAISRKLIRSSAWEREDFYLGIDLSIAAISSGLIYISDLIAAKAASIGCSTSACRELLTTADVRLMADAGFLVVALVAFLYLLAIHQDQARNTGNRREQLLLLGGVSNAIGIGLFIGFIIIVKGIGR